ncbi:MAG TPA: hypothetical protein VH619_16255 [Verrucomicrobiae bacterium]|jgi:hypothetical protein|nr:hypothetical protein [Verrucomicrobiae bacterium]
MNPESDKQLEAQTGRLLKDLPDLAAPRELVSRTMNRITQPASPWISRPWFAWPAGFRVAYLIFALGVLAGAIFGWRAVAPEMFGTLAARFSHWTAGAPHLWNALGVLGDALVAILDHFGKGFMLAFILAAAIAYAVCIGLGTVFVRLVLGAPQKNHL